MLLLLIKSLSPRLGWFTWFQKEVLSSSHRESGLQWLWWVQVSHLHQGTAGLSTLQSSRFKHDNVASGWYWTTPISLKREGDLREGCLFFQRMVGQADRVGCLEDSTAVLRQRWPRAPQKQLPVGICSLCCFYSPVIPLGSLRLSEKGQSSDFDEGRIIFLCRKTDFIFLPRKLVRHDWVATTSRLVRACTSFYSILCLGREPSSVLRDLGHNNVLGNSCSIWLDVWKSSDFISTAKK